MRPPDLWSLPDAALFLDIDGTILELAPEPSAVTVPNSLPPLLEQLGRDLSGALAIVTGRQLGDVDRLLSESVDAIGSHGACWRRAGRTGTESPPVPAAVVAALRAALQFRPLVLIEDKSTSVAVHYRRTMADSDLVFRCCKKIAAMHGTSLEVMRGNAVVEIKHRGHSKGHAIAEFMRHEPYRGRTPVFLGDDLTDESGFATVNEMQGLSVRVGRNPAATQARYRLAAPADVLAWLWHAQKPDLRSKA